MSAAEKQRTIESLLAQGVLVHLDPRREGVVVSPQHSKHAHLVLYIGLNTPSPIADLVVDEKGFRGTLSFDRQPHYCNVPWSAVYAVVNALGKLVTLWREDAPEEVLEAILHAEEHERLSRKGRVLS